MTAAVSVGRIAWQGQVSLRYFCCHAIATSNVIDPNINCVAFICCRYHILLILTPGYKWVTIRRFCLTYSRHTLPVASFSFASSLDCITQDVSLPFHAVSCAIYHTSSQLEKEVRKCMMLSNSFDKSKPVPLADRLHSTEKFHD